MPACRDRRRPCLQSPCSRLQAGCRGLTRGSCHALDDKDRHRPVPRHRPHRPGDPALYTEDARLDATVPGWRFQAQGPIQIAAEYSSWFASPSELHALERIPIPGGEVVRYLHTFDLGGKQHAAHHVHLLQVRDDQICSDTVFCGGRWGPEVLAQMGAAAHAG